MKLLTSSIMIVCFLGVVSAQQVQVDRIEQMPAIPEPYIIRNWDEVAHNYDSMVFNLQSIGQYLPLVSVNNSGINYPNHESAAMVSYVGKVLGNSAEAINYLPSLIGATLSGVDKSNQFGYNWVLMGEDFFNKRPQENIYLNHPSANSGVDWWYETMPNAFFYQLYDLYPNTGDFSNQFITVADRWLEAIENMGGKVTPWQLPNMNYRAWNFSRMKPLTEGVKEPEAAGVIAWILYNAYTETGVLKYLYGAELALEYLNNLTENPSYEIQLPYGVNVAARMNAELGTNFNIDKMLNWCFNRGNLRGWGCIVGDWNGYDCSGLIGEANDAGNDYAFLMNGFQHASALLPLVRYNEFYANAIGKWILNLANASRLFYPGYLPADHQDSEEWSVLYDTKSSIAHEALRETYNGKSPFSTGDAINGGWAPTNLALYGSSHVGYLAGILDTTDVKAILQLDLCKTDFFGLSYPTYLLWNPYENDTNVTIDVGSNPVDIYNSIINNFINNDITGSLQVNIPAGQSALLVYVPTGSVISTNEQLTLADSVVIDFDNGNIIIDHPPRIKALKALNNPVLINDSIYVYCTAEDIDGDALLYEWLVNGKLIETQSVLDFKAPDTSTVYSIQCKVYTLSGKADSLTIILEVKERIPHIPEIITLKASPGKIDALQATTVVCEVYEENGDDLNFNWQVSEGELSGDGDSVHWTAPSAYGDYKISCSVSDIDGLVKDSTYIMVRSLSGFTMGTPVLYLPFNGNSNDVSIYKHNTTRFNVEYTNDVNNIPLYSAVFNGSSAYVLVDNSEPLNFTDAMALTGWIYSLHSDAGEAYPVSHGNWDNRWKVSFSNNTLRYTINTNTGISDLDSRTDLNLEKWYHFAMVYTGTDMELYINGELDAFKPFSGNIKTTSYDISIGRARPDLAYFFEGNLDNLILFDHALSPSHIKEIYQEGFATVHSKLHSKDIIIFPNPTSGSINIEVKGIPKQCLYKVTEITGKLIKQGECNILKTNGNSAFYAIDLLNVDTGIYFLQVNTGKEQYYNKFIKLNK